VAGQSVSRLDLLLRRTSTVYDVAGRSVASINGLWQRTSTVYDAAGQSVAVVNGLGYRTSHAYDGAGRRVRLTDARVYATTFVFDAAGQDVGRMDPLGRRSTFSYDLAGRRTVDRDARGARVSYAYDGAGQKVGENLSSGTRSTFAYDRAGRRQLVSDSTGRVSTVYDGAGQTVGVSQPLGKRVTYAYDVAGWRRSVRDPDGGRITYTHDAAGQLVVLSSAQNGRTTFGYDVAGREAVKRLANGVRVTQTYDPAGRVAGVSTGGPAGLVRRLTYALDVVGRRSGIGSSDGARTTYSYDGAGQLRREQRFTSGINLTHAYDPVGNRVVQTDSGTRTTYVYDGANQLGREQTNTARTTYVYDGAGNRVQKADPASTTYYVWDAKSRLVVAEPVSGRVTYGYDGIGRRATKNSVSGAVRFVWDFKKVLQEADGGTGATEYQFVTTEGEYGDLVSGYGNGSTKYYGFDGLGSTELLLDDTGSVTAKFEYRAFGLTSESGGGDGPGLALPAPLPSELGGGVSAQTGEPFAFVGQQGCFHDTEAGLYFLGAGGGTAAGEGGRVYEPQTIVFLSKDRIEERSGQTNWYLYCGNDPVNKTDPSGNAEVATIRYNEICTNHYLDITTKEVLPINKPTGSKSVAPTTTSDTPVCPPGIEFTRFAMPGSPPAESPLDLAIAIYVQAMQGENASVGGNLVEVRKIKRDLELGILAFNKFTGSIVSGNFGEAAKVARMFANWGFEYLNGELRLIIGKVELKLKVAKEKAEEILRKIYDAGNDVRELIETLAEIGVEIGPDIVEAILKDPQAFANNLKDCFQDGLADFIKDFPATFQDQLLKWMMIEDDLKKFPKDLTDSEAVGRWALDFFRLNKEGVIALLIEELGPEQVGVIIEIYNQLESVDGNFAEYLKRYGPEFDPSKLGEKVLDALKQKLADELKTRAEQAIITRAAPVIGQVQTGLSTLEWVAGNLKSFKAGAKGTKDLANAVARAGQGNADDKARVRELVKENLDRTVPLGINLAVKQGGLEGLPQKIKEKINALRE